MAFRSFTEPYFDSCGVFKDAVIAIMATLAKQERIKRAERTRAGLARVRDAGKRLGRPVRLNGEHTAEIARLRSGGLSLRAISRELGISDRSVRRDVRPETLAKVTQPIRFENTSVLPTSSSPFLSHGDRLSRTVNKRPSKSIPACAHARF